MNHKDDEKPAEVNGPESVEEEPTKESPGAVDEQPVAETSSHEAPGPEKSASTPRSSGTSVGLFGLLIALLAAGGAGYVWWEQQAQSGLAERLGDLQTALAQRTRELERLGGEIASLADAEQNLTDDVASLDEKLESQNRQLEEIPLRIGRLERTLDNVPGVAVKARSAWLLAEAEYFLRIANAQLSLAGNVDVALKALDLADEKLRDLADPGLSRVRALLSDERTALKAVPRPDREGIVLSLGSLSRSLDTLPLDRNAPGRFSGQNGSDDDSSGLARAWRVIVDAFFSIVSVKRSDDAVTPLMSAEEESMLIRSLDIELQIARLAVLRNETQIYKRSLGAAKGRLESYFDIESINVKAALSTVDELADAELPSELPDISGSLTLLLRLGNEAASP